MSVIVFVGPTLAPAEGRWPIDADFLPPASQGDVYRAACTRPDAIGIIDGYFDRVPAIWHKEILWAMAQGIPVYGSASMGALRAAELADFGMIGVGAIFDAFRSGELEDDDEVAVAHASKEDGYRPVSEAMVNIRATLLRAKREGVLSPRTHAAMIEVAKETFYAERSYAGLHESCSSQTLPPSELQGLRRWLPGGRVNQKRDDALLMLQRMQVDLATGSRPKRAAYTFEHTTWWELVTGSETPAPQEAPEETGAPDALGEQWIEDELQLFIPRAVVRAAKKRQVLAQGASGGNEAEEALALEWYFRERLLTAVPDNLESHVRNVGLGSVDTFRRAVWREFTYLKHR